jgi:DNA-binding MarR family transcriptional regulator
VSSRAQAHARWSRDKHDGDLGGHPSVAVWLRLLSCATVIEKRLRRRFAAQHGTTLPRFDVMAALDRAPDGLALSALSARLLVSNGNVTALVQALARDGLVELRVNPADRRSSIAALTPAGREQFAALAAAHHGWIEAMFAHVGHQQRETLFALLGTVKASVNADREDDDV